RDAQLERRLGEAAVLDDREQRPQALEPHEASVAAGRPWAVAGGAAHGLIANREGAGSEQPSGPRGPARRRASARPPAAPGTAPRPRRPGRRRAGGAGRPRTRTDAPTPRPAPQAACRGSPWARTGAGTARRRARRSSPGRTGRTRRRPGRARRARASPGAPRPATP